MIPLKEYQENEEIELEIEEESCIPCQLICVSIIVCIFIFIGILLGQVVKN
jgi:hypothetical protein